MRNIRSLHAQYAKQGLQEELTLSHRGFRTILAFLILAAAVAAFLYYIEPTDPGAKTFYTIVMAVPFLFPGAPLYTLLLRPWVFLHKRTLTLGVQGLRLSGFNITIPWRDVGLAILSVRRLSLSTKLTQPRDFAGVACVFRHHQTFSKRQIKKQTRINKYNDIGFLSEKFSEPIHKMPLRLCLESVQPRGVRHLLENVDTLWREHYDGRMVDVVGNAPNVIVIECGNVRDAALLMEIINSEVLKSAGLNPRKLLTTPEQCVAQVEPLLMDHFKQVSNFHPICTALHPLSAADQEQLGAFDPHGKNNIARAAAPQPLRTSPLILPLPKRVSTIVTLLIGVTLSTPLSLAATVYSGDWRAIGAISVVLALTLLLPLAQTLRVFFKGRARLTDAGIFLSQEEAQFAWDRVSPAWIAAGQSNDVCFYARRKPRTKWRYRALYKGVPRAKRYALRTARDPQAQLALQSVREGLKVALQEQRFGALEHTSQWEQGDTEIAPIVLCFDEGERQQAAAVRDAINQAVYREIIRRNGLEEAASLSSARTQGDVNSERHDIAP
ncbi:hypothetical protein [Magnetofaba australis]|uniref:Uncharacterized protein n=1 Tax=Magnetofaba australis IT-1 TaxID=1434232 RepID=A0A1Y2K882_9PROT|nr:hypothetical protein [Magnetofaba australis]OSM06892.1 hypothetical protein MAIT1_00227 [Magnetofaba australis IT-1]